MSHQEFALWKDGILGSGSTYRVLNTGNELASITWKFDPPLENAGAINFSGLTGNWGKQSSNRSQIRVRILNAKGALKWSLSGNHINGPKNTLHAFKKNAYSLGGIQVAEIYLARQKSRGIKFSGVTTNQPASASFFIRYTPTTPSIESVVSLSSSMVVNINNPADGLILSVGDLDFEVDGDSDSVVIKDLEPSTIYDITLKR